MSLVHVTSNGTSEHCLNRN